MPCPPPLPVQQGTHDSNSATVSEKQDMHGVGVPDGRQDSGQELDVPGNAKQPAGTASRSELPHTGGNHRLRQEPEGAEQPEAQGRPGTLPRRDTGLRPTESLHDDATPSSARPKAYIAPEGGPRSRSADRAGLRGAPPTGLAPLHLPRPPVDPVEDDPARGDLDLPELVPTRDEARAQVDEGQKRSQNQEADQAVPDRRRDPREESEPPPPPAPRASCC